MRLWTADEQGWRKASPSEVLAAAATLDGAERLWVCDYPEFNDEHCYFGHTNPQPELARLARKHTQCGWRLVIPLPDKETP